jgi:hypothetical protein
MKAEDKKLLRLYNSLPEGQKETVLAFVEFLAARAGSEETPAAAEPLSIPRPEQESVVKAIRRLMATYPMLDRDRLFHETSGHMTQHVIHGKPATEVIDELEIMFARHYERHRTGE